MKNPLLYILPLLLAILTQAACNPSHDTGVPNAAPAVYYWRTTLKLDSTERAFLQANGVKKMYTRFFDVVMRDDKPMPNATLRFLDPAPQGVEIIPVIFIMENCLAHDIDSYAELIVNRVLQMCETNDLPAPHELQIDCDWTKSSLETYYRFLKLVRRHTDLHDMRLSATIRLHQLDMTPPPVDYGVLMVYNTGDARKLNGHNPILDYRDVTAYASRLPRYSLPLCAAYPTYDWQLLFGSDGEFKAILHDEDLTDSTLYRNVKPNRWLVVARRDLPELSDDAETTTWITPGDSVVRWTVPAAEIGRVARDLQRHRSTINSQVVLYSLDSKNIKRYNTDDYETFFNP